MFWFSDVFQVQDKSMYVKILQNTQFYIANFSSKTAPTETRLNSKVFSLERLYKIFVQKNFKKKFGSKKCFGLKKNLSKKKLWSEKNLGP